MATREEILNEVLSLPAHDRAEIVEALLSSFDKPDVAMDALWAKEAEARLDACDSGELKVIPLGDVLEKTNMRPHSSAHEQRMRGTPE